jgi:hypothetical protein
MERPLLRLISIVAFATVAVLAQEFEVASVKPAAPQTGEGTFVGIRGGPGTQNPNHRVRE